MVDVNDVEQEIKAAAPGLLAKAKAAIAGSLSWTSGAYFAAGYFAYPFLKPLISLVVSIAKLALKL